MESNSELAGLRNAAREIFDHALRSVDACKAVRATVSLAGSQLKIAGNYFDCSDKKLYLIAIGKAAHAMALGLTDIVGPMIISGVLAGPLWEDGIELDSRWQLFNGGHPVPNDESLKAAQAAFALLERANQERAPVIFLISGGGSAMLEWPVNDKITLEDLQEANRVLIASGANIDEINSVRRAFSAVKGGGLAAHAPLANQFTLIVSDTNPGDPSNVASGPSLEPGRDAVDPREVISRYLLRTSLPSAIVAAIEQYRTPDRTFSDKTILHSHVLLSNQDALNAAAEVARQRGFTTQIADDIREQPIEEGCRLLWSRAGAIDAREQKICLLSGGEFSCPVRGDGVGGRNLETVLRSALEIDRDGKPAEKSDLIVLSAGTDGIDGNSPAAGAIADQTTISRARKRRLNASSFLEKSDSFHFFSQLGDTITTGPTGTNVRDLRIILISP